MAENADTADTAAPSGSALELSDLRPPFALLRREGRPAVELLRGHLVEVARLADLPVAPGVEQLALVPYRQLKERGDACHDDGAPLVSLIIHSRRELAPEDLPQPPEPVIADGRFDVPDDAYARQVKAVLDDEIARGEGANFVLRRSYTGTCADPLAAAVAAFNVLLARERSAYWTFLVHTGSLIAVGATPERHVSLHADETGAPGLLAVMNPISGTLRRPPATASFEDVARFLEDPKERDELAMVVDEELKMLADVGGHGRVTGPFLKEMRHLAHTEYYIEARTTMDVREILRTTMFAPTATGSPIRNAFRVIERNETGGRGYYGSVAALLGHDDSGRQRMDASLLLRVAYIDPADGSIRVPVGATLVRGSDPYEEVRETYAKAAGVLRAFGAVVDTVGAVGTVGTVTAAGPRTAPAENAADPAETVRWSRDPRVRALLDRRNERLAPFWLQEHGPRAFESPALIGRSALIVDNEDAFTSMLAVQLRALGMRVERRHFAAVDGTAGYEVLDGTEASDLVVLGPGPGDPRSDALAKVRFGRALLGRLLPRRAPLLAVCLGHQMLCDALGFELAALPAPNQGTQIEVDLFGRRDAVGFYNSFTALAPQRPPEGVELALLDGTDRVAALRGPHYAGLQFHAESVFSLDGINILRREIERLLG
ncbi:MAG TPA: anthranilate synthase family protein [Actinocrinis sp.]